MSLNFISKLTKDKSRHSTSIKRNKPNILFTYLNNYKCPKTSLSIERFTSRINYSKKNIYKSELYKKDSSKEKDEIIKKLKNKVKELEKKIILLKLKLHNLTRANISYPTSSKNYKNHSISAKDTVSNKKKVKPIFVPKKKFSLKERHSKNAVPCKLLKEESNFCTKEERSNNTNINISNSISNSNMILNNANKSKNKNKNKIELINKKKKYINFQKINDILKKAIITKYNLKKKSKESNYNVNELDLKTGSKLISKIPKTTRHYFQIESNTNLSSKTTSSTTFNYYKLNNSYNFLDNNNCLTSKNYIYTEEGDTNKEYPNNSPNISKINNNSNEDLKNKLNQIKLRTEYLLEIFSNIKVTKNNKIL
jgi:hypothetical protein